VCQQAREPAYRTGRHFFSLTCLPAGRLGTFCACLRGAASAKAGQDKKYKEKEIVVL